MLLAACTAASSEPSASQAGASESAAASDGGVSVHPYTARIEAEKATEVDTSSWAADGPYTIGFSSQGTFNGFGLMLDAAMREAAAASDQVEQLIVANGDGDSNKQISAVEDMIEQGVDAIVLQPLGHAALSATVDRATAAGIPVIMCLDGVETDSYVSRVDVDLYQIAYEVATAMAEDLGGEGKVLLLSGIPGVDAAEIWMEAAADAMGVYPGIDVVGSEFSNWSIADAKTLTSQVLSREGEINGVFAGGAENAIGAINAVEEDGGAMPVFGVTNPLNGFLRLAIEHDLVFTAAPDPPGTSPLCLDTALQVLNGEPVQKFVDIAAVVDGAAIFDESEVQDRYDERYNDEYTYPTLISDEGAIAAGFGR
jgi:ribose transport system substrate-binding protein